MADPAAESEAINSADAPETNLKWKDTTDTGETPGPRFGHTLSIVGSTAYLFGAAMEWSQVEVEGEAPPPRWRHSATVIDKTRILLFGGFHSRSVRLNDVWLLDTLNMCWECLHHGERPPSDHTYRHVVELDREAAAKAAGGLAGEEEGEDEEGAGQKPKAEGAVVGGTEDAPNEITGTPPYPRGGHTASQIGNSIYIFGGYGGSGYGRRDFNDLWSLNLASYSWERLVTKGPAPEPRSGHSAAAVESTVFVYGGRSSAAQFGDMFSLDVGTLTWTQLAEQTVPRWNHSMVCVKAIPNTKLFVFGGCVGDLNETQQLKGEYVNEVRVMDTGMLTWSAPEVVGTPPTPRAEAAVDYNPKSSRLLLHGGWANRWRADGAVLDVGSVVGPPYAVTAIEPANGPITGGQRMIIRGIEFYHSSSLQVRFSGRRGSEEVEGKFLSASEIECTTPDFELFGAGEVDVRVSIGGDTYTTTFCRYTFFSVTHADSTLVYGPGVLAGGLAGHRVEFIIEARDVKGFRRVTGGDEFTVRVQPHDKKGEIEGSVEDLGEGLYRASYVPPVAGRYSVHVRFEGTFGSAAGPVWGSPFEASFISGVDKASNQVKGPLATRWLREMVEELRDTAEDTRSGLMTKIKDADSTTVVTVKEHIHKVEERGDVFARRVATVQAYLDHLKGLGVTTLGALEKELLSAQGTWAEVQKMVPSVRSALQPLVRRHGQRAKQEIVHYERDCESYAKAMRRAPFWDSLPCTKAEAALAEAHETHTARMDDFAKRMHLADMLEFADALEPSRETLDGVAHELDLAEEMWALVREAEAFFEGAKDTLWSRLKPEEMEEATRALQKRVRALPREVRWCNAYTDLDRRVKHFMRACPLVGSLAHPAMRPRHWEELMNATGQRFTPPHESPDMRLRELLDLGLHKHEQEVEEITDKAQKEAKIEVSLEKLEETWSAIQWRTEEVTTAASAAAKAQGAGPKVQTVALAADDTETLENDQLAVQGMLGSRALAYFEPAVRSWHADLAAVGDVVQLLADVQRGWVYLGPLFLTSDEVKRELPDEAARFERVDVDVRQVLARATAAPNVRSACTEDGLQAKLEGVAESLALCKKALGDFLDGKRRLFPRFYFVSEADLLDMLSNGSNPARILHHVGKIFLATDALELDQDADSEPQAEPPNAMRFVAGIGEEELEFERPVQLEGRVEHYLKRVHEEMAVTLQRQLDRCATRYPTQSRSKWLLADQGEAAQVRVLVAAAEFVRSCEEALDRVESGSQPQALTQFQDMQRQQLTDLIRLTQGDLSRGERQVVMVMITMDAHARDVVARMLREGVKSKTAFQWQSQLKQRLTEARDGARVEVVDASFDYGFEYLGNGPRLVITPLTDRIYVTATQALNLKMGCAPAGPAGTGKTETTKDLASALGKACYVFNCSPEMDYKSMGNIFKGLAASGAWGCFDEFNRLIPEVLSVCSVQFKAVCDAVRARSEKVTIEGDTVACDWTVGVFITMNPGYLGRSELPEGLKSLFRPITVMVPDLVLICENMLMAEGFEDAKALASKFYGLYSLLDALLSKQSHYDWGLRAVKSVLVVAGAYKRAEPEMGEQDLLMRALRDMNTPKIVQQDMVVFSGLLGDLFPGIDPPRKSDPDMETRVREASLARGLWPDEGFQLKCVQLDELMAIRHCVFVLGATASGKSECWKTLARGKGLQLAHVRDLNPKAVSTEELYGYVTLKSREWKDGLLSMTMRDLGQIPGTDPKWIILDGDLDANWIESMNSVMDDNKMLTLASNERIPLKAHMKMLFEIRDLRFATPATVSRAGILYVGTDGGRQWSSLLAAWVRKQADMAEAVREGLQQLFDAYLPPLVRFLEREARPLVAVPAISCVQVLLHMLEGLLGEDVLARAAEEAEGGKSPAEAAAKVLETPVTFALVWAFGSGLATVEGVNYRDRFSEYFRSTFKASRFPGRETVFDYWLDPATGKFEPWKKCPFYYGVDFDSKTMRMGEMTVPTPETAAVMHWADLLVRQRRPVMLVGLSGSGKTQLVQGLLGRLDPATHRGAAVNFNYFTDARALQRVLGTYLERKSGQNYGPAGNSRLVAFLDDLNLPEVDPYGTQSAIALVRQLLDYHHYYDMAKLAPYNVMDVQYVAAMNPTAGSFAVNPRLQRHFATFAVDFPGPTSLLTIFQTFLNGHLKHFPSAVQSLSGAVINAALELHAKVAQSFRKSAVNFHYEFSLRHLSSVLQGLLTAEAPEFRSPDLVVELWAHESARVYGDRLVSRADVARFNGLLLSTAKKRLAAHAQGLSKHFDTAVTGGGSKKKAPPPLLFTRFAGRHAREGAYAKVKSVEELRHTLTEAMHEYSDTVATMDLVLFADAIEHVCRIARIISGPGGHALVVGVGGSGKRSLSRLAAFVCGHAVHSITVHGGYGVPELRDDLKDMFTKAGVRGEGLVFLFTDSQLVDERFLVSFNDLLASGDVPDLFSPEDKDDILGSLTPKAKAQGLSTERAAVWAHFLAQVQRNLHVVLCMSPAGDAFRTRCLRFPALVSCTGIDWFQPWPEEALYSVATAALADVDFLAETETENDALRRTVESFMPFSMTSVNEVASEFLRVERRHVHNTPKSFLTLLSLFASLMERKRAEIDTATERLEAGLSKLRQTAADAETMEKDLVGLLERASEKKERASRIAGDVKAEKEGVEKETAKAASEEAKCKKISDSVGRQQRECEEELAKAEPMVERAMAALDTLDKKDLGTCKTMSTPPKGVDDIFVAVQVLFASMDPAIPLDNKQLPKDRTWAGVKKQMLGNIAGFMDQLKSYKALVDGDEVPDANMKEVRRYLDQEHFDVEVIATKNSAAGGLCAWVQNIVKYYDVVKGVRPKREALEKANHQLERANVALQAVQENVAALQKKLDALTQEFEEAEAERAAANKEVKNAKSKLNLARRLTRALGDENERWASGIERLNGERKVLVGDVLLASAFISYIGPFDKRFRGEMLARWVRFLGTAHGGGPLPMSAAADPLSVLTNEAELATWSNEGLPADPVSQQNGAIVKSSLRWPLLVDPQLQGVAWVKEHEAKRFLRVVRQDSAGLMSVLEDAVEHGKCVLLENLGESVDAVLMPLVARATFRRGKREFVRVGEAEVPLDPSFRLYLHTKLPNPHYPPEIQAECTVVNFSVTEEGLEDQLLARVVEKERPDLAKQKAALIQQQNRFKVEIKRVEDEILERLATAEGVITENVELIESLESAKKISNEVAEKAEVAKKTAADINETSEQYRPVASRGSLLFFLMNELSKVHTYYVYSLSAFITTFLHGIDTTPHAEGGRRRGGRRALTAEQLAARCSALKDTITRVVFNYLRRGLFQRDALTVATQLCLQVLEREGTLSPDVVMMLKTSPQASDPGARGPVSDWMPEATWARVKALERVPELKSLGEDMQSECDAWEAWFDLELPEGSPMPGKYKKATPFSHLLVLKAMRPDRMVSALTAFVGESLGKEFVEQAPLDMEQLYTETAPGTPTFFVLFPGVDPTAWVEALGEKHGFSNANGRLRNISMGQGQEAPAEAALRTFAEEGGWIMLQNCHLMQSWLPRLERELELAAESAHEDFRCFVSAEPPPLSHMKNMPESLMQTCIKVANEAPADLKSNLRRAWALIPPEKVDASPRPQEYRACLFTLCTYHALVLGRRRFGQQGWSRPYSFNQGDLTVCADVLMKQLQEGRSVPWEDLRYIIGEIMYGGHITDPWDRRINVAYLSLLLTPSVFQEGPLLPNGAFPAPPLSAAHEDYAAHIEQSLPAEAPQLVGLHPNAEIGYLTATTQRLFDTILDLEGIVVGVGTGGEAEEGGGEGEGERQSAAERRTAAVRGVVRDLLARLPAPLAMAAVHERAEERLQGEDAPYVVVVVQECTRMNTLVEHVRGSLDELERGMNGELNMSEPMEHLAEALAQGQVPGRNPFHKQSWEKLAWWSRKALGPWFEDLLQRMEQLKEWAAELRMPPTLWLPGLFNPTAFLTAVMQVTARRRGLPLDNMTVETHVTAMLTPGQVGAAPEEGAFVHGLYMQGARWLDPRDAVEQETVDGVTCAGYVVDSRFKELLAPMPVMFVRAVEVQPAWVPASVGYLRPEADVYNCPVYHTSQRGPTFVFLATLRSKEAVEKWVLAGAALLMQTDE